MKLALVNWVSLFKFFIARLLFKPGLCSNSLVKFQVFLVNFVVSVLFLFNFGTCVFYVFIVLTETGSWKKLSGTFLALWFYLLCFLSLQTLSSLGILQALEITLVS